MDAVAMIATGKSTVALFLGLTALGLTTYKWPTHVPVQDKAAYDYIVVGAGTAGSVVANRLSEDPNVSVLLIEAGGDPHWEAQHPILFPYLTKSEMDWKYISEDDGYSAQYHRNKYLDLPSGKVLGGSSTLHHFYYVRGDPYDYKLWAEAANDNSWNWWNLLPYFKKSERLEDQYIIDSETASFHGMDGPVAITRETRSQSLKYLEAFGEVGHKIMDDSTTNDTMGFARPLWYISKEGYRQSSAECFLSPAKGRSNLHVMKSTTVTKVLIEGDKAIGVECSTPDGIINIYANKETILSAGAFNTPKILMLSGVGPKDHLESVGIPVIYDSPVGRNLQDHVAVVVAHKLEQTNDAAAPQPPSDFPVPTFIGSGAFKKGQDYSDWVTLNLICRNNPAALLLLSSIVFGLHDDVCNQLAAAGTGSEVLFTVFNKARPSSTGRVELRSSDPNDSPKIFTGHLSDSTDLEDNAKWIQDFIKVTQSSYFKKVGGETIYVDLPNCKGLDHDTTEYWKCYVLNMMDTTFHYSSTCRMGSVLDSRLRVLGIKNLRVGDASAMPNQVTGNINTAVMVLAEKMADMIKEDN
ncbi:ecdysone oxidase-like [Maniola hyperantus]|uniref:ecdysone oxidase-like n=1 Tax=Aphantopus hyperantus TaxID=2795564 RepID=UPI001567E200|nr:glucose dehydrogenase [FAD, quinone]-like [Maniola hyperantus]